MFSASIFSAVWPDGCESCALSLHAALLQKRRRSLDPKPNPLSSCKHAIILCYFRLAQKKVTRDNKSLALGGTRLLYVCYPLVGPGQHPQYTRAPAGGGCGWASYLQNNSVRNSVRKTSIGVFGTSPRGGVPAAAWFDVEEMRQATG